MRPHVFAAAALMLLPLAASSGAQQGEAMRFRGMDRNGDGMVTRAEWRGSDRSFRVHDWNGDGVLSGDEVRVGARRHVDDLDFDPDTREFVDWTEQRFASLDRNRDGRISAREWHYDTESFLRADRNGDRVLTKAEFLGHDVDDDRNDRFEYLDMNNSGRIERSEWHGSRDAFVWLDRNRDGVLSRAEVVGEETQQRSDLFASLDFNRDDRISQEEWQWSRRSFLRRDTNRDGVLSRDEFAAAAADIVGTTGQTLGTTGQTIVVDATERWTDSGVDVRQGQTIRVTAQGTIQMSTNVSDLADPSGSQSGRRAQNAPLPQQSAGALIARIDGSAPILVGDNGSLTAPVSGRLYFGVNDDHLPDNRGSYRVTIMVTDR